MLYKASYVQAYPTYDVPLSVLSYYSDLKPVDHFCLTPRSIHELVEAKVMLAARRGDQCDEDRAERKLATEARDTLLAEQYRTTLGITSFIPRTDEEEYLAWVQLGRWSKLESTDLPTREQV